MERVPLLGKYLEVVLLMGLTGCWCRVGASEDDAQ